MLKRVMKAATLVCTATVLSIASATAQAFPTKPIRLIVPLAQAAVTRIFWPASWPTTSARRRTGRSWWTTARAVLALLLWDLSPVRRQMVMKSF